MIVDCFTFFDELDVLEIRLSMLDAVVDRFVLCESPYTFRGERKALVFAENAERFARWADRIVHLVYDGAPRENPWENEFAQRAHLGVALHGLPADALVLVGDVDEIPPPEQVATRPQPGRAIGYVMLNAVGYVNRIENVIQCTKAMTLGDFGARSPQDLRSATRDVTDYVFAGWHLSSFGGPQRWIDKTRACSHTELDIPYLTDARRQRIAFDSVAQATYVPLDERFPAELRRPRWARYVWPGPTYVDADEARALMHANGCYAYVPPAAARVAAWVRDRENDWMAVGRERFGAAFAGAVPGSRAVGAEVGPGDWIVLDGSQAALDVLPRLAAARPNVVLASPNARCIVYAKGVLEGRPLPPGPSFGLVELEQAITQAGFRVVRRDDVVESLFPPAFFWREGRFDALGWPFRFHQTTSATLRALATSSFVFVLEPATV